MKLKKDKLFYDYFAKETSRFLKLFLDFRQKVAYKKKHLALVAQLDRVLPSEGKGRGFESRQARHPSR